MWLMLSWPCQSAGYLYLWHGMTTSVCFWPVSQHKVLSFGPLREEVMQPYPKSSLSICCEVFYVVYDQKNSCLCVWPKHILTFRQCHSSQQLLLYVTLWLKQNIYIITFSWVSQGFADWFQLKWENRNKITNSSFSPLSLHLCVLFMIWIPIVLFHSLVVTSDGVL